MHKPAFLILDEPVTRIDPYHTFEMRSFIRCFAERKTAIFSTHISQEAENIFDRIILLDKGRLLSDASLDEIRQSYNSVEEVFQNLSNSSVFY